MFMAYKGIFQPTNPGKYKGDPSNIIYRSSWELRCMKYFDLNNNIIEWASEELAIPYKSPIDGRLHRYYPDFIVKAQQASGGVQTIMVEVKPYYQTQEPVVKKRKTKRYLNEVKTYAINRYKWDAAEDYCKDRKWKFLILTERELNI